MARRFSDDASEKSCIGLRFQRRPTGRQFGSWEFIMSRKCGFGGAYFEDVKAASPIEEYLIDVSLASFASSSATASSVSIRCASMPSKQEGLVKQNVSAWEDV